jgi:GT2 family glycosyltransferase
MTEARRDRVTVGVASRDRPESLARCLRSLRLVHGLVAEAIVVDDGSGAPLEPAVRVALGEEAPPGLRFIRFETSRSVAAARNAITREASCEWVLNLDDDAMLVSGDAVRRAVEVIAADPRVAAVAFAQANERGETAGLPQPAPVDYPSYVPTFIGFAHLLRRSAFLAVGGYREQIGINGEEKELCLRLLDGGWSTVYLPDAPVAHLADPAGRDPRTYLHQTVRNTTLASVYNDPFPLVLASAPVRLARYFPMRKGWRISDPGGFGDVVRGLVRDLPAALRQRRPVKWSTLRRWRELGRTRPRYEGPSSGSGG